jgi:hypothetical protein
VAFMWYRMHENVAVFVVPCDGSIPPVALTHTPEGTELENWTADSRAVIVSEDEGQGIQKPANQARLYTRLGEFFERTLA